MRIFKFFAAIGIAAVALHAQDHGHLNAGAISQQAGSQLIFANGAVFATNSGYVKTLTFTNGATHAGYFQGNTTLTVLPATAERGGPDPQAPALGSRIVAQLVSLEGPQDGEFGFWNTGATSPTFSIKSGEKNGANTWVLSENDGSPGADPYGHIHGRRMTLTKAGLYIVGLRLIDVSTNGPDGGPIHTSSEILYTYFQAGVNGLAVEAAPESATVKFALPLGTIWQFEATDSLTSPQWTPVGDPIPGDDLIHAAVDERIATDQRYYRVRSVPQ